MTAIALTNSGIQTVKRALQARFPDEKSAHLAEALAAACGCNTHAALLTELKRSNPADPDYVLLDEMAFLRRRRELTGKPIGSEEQHWSFEYLSYPTHDDVIKTTSSRFHEVNYATSARRRAWRNAMVAAINAGIDQRLFTVRSGDNRWPGSEKEKFEQPEAHVFQFMLNRIPAVASVFDAGWDELSIHVALWPTAEGDRWVKAANAGFLAGDLFASGWLERRNGAWLQVSSDRNQNWSFRCRKNRLDQIAGLDIRPKGYADRGNFKL